MIGPRRLPSDAGLTILELMVVLVILSIIGVVVSCQVVGQMDRAKVDVAALQLRQLQGALMLSRSTRIVTRRTKRASALCLCRPMR